MEGRPRLESWKEISSYVGRSIKTCQRWELDLGLPVHRLDGTPSARVFANPAELDAWIEEKLNHREVAVAGRKLARGRKIMGWAVATTIVLILTVAAALTRRFYFAPAVSFPSSRLANVVFLPFENVTGDEMLEFWRFALPRLFHIDFLQSAVVGTTDPWVTLKKLGLSEARKFSAEDLGKIAADFSDDYLATGSLIKSGQDFIIHVALYRGKAAVAIQSFRAISRTEKGVFKEVDNLTRTLKLAMGIPPRLVSRDTDEEISQIATDSPEALKFYCRGIRLEMAGKVEEAVPLLRKATEIDPEFSEAYSHLFTANEMLYSCCESPGAREEAIRAGEKAFESSSRLNARSRADLVGEYFLDFQKDLGRAITEYQRLLPLLENDPAILLQLAKIYYDLEEYDEVVALFERYPPQEFWAPVHLLANCYFRRGEFAQAEKVLDAYMSKADSSNPFLYYDRQIYALDQGRYEDALTYNDRMRSSYSIISVHNSKAPLFISQDDFANAEGELWRVVDFGKSREKFEGHLGLAGLLLAQGKVGEAAYVTRLAIDLSTKLRDWSAMKRTHSFMAHLEGLRGNPLEALREAEQACPCYQEDDVIVDEEAKRRIIHNIDDIYCLRYFHQRALVSLMLGRMEDFDRQAAEIKQVIDKGQHPRLLRVYYHLLGRRELRKGDSGSAIDFFWKALNRLPSPQGHEADIDSTQYFYSLAEAYELAGRQRMALEFYKKIPSSWELKIRSGDLYARSFYRMAKIYDQNGRSPGASEDQIKADRGLAAENYRKFLGLWKDADPVFAAEVQDAARRLAALESELAASASGPVK